MALFCPICSEPIAPETTECSSCCTIYDDDSLGLLKIISEKADEGYSDEHRKQVRFPTKLKVAYFTAQAFMDHYIFNLSLGGLFIEKNNPLEPGEKFELRIFLLDKTEPMEVPCEVMWSRKKEEKEELTPEGKLLPAGMGVKFLNLSKDNIKRLIDVLNRSLT